MLNKLLHFLATALVIQAPLLAHAADSTANVDAKVDALLKQMTLEEKVAQMALYLPSDLDKPENHAILTTLGAGAVHSDLTPEECNHFETEAAKSRLKIPIFCEGNCIHGNALTPGATVFSTSISLAATFDVDLARASAAQAFKEIRGWGYSWTFSPTMDVTQDARFGRTGESFGECPYLSTAMAEALVLGLQGTDVPYHVAACAKHFVGGGYSVDGVNHGTAELSERTLRTVFLAPFKAAVDDGCLTIMAGHNDVDGIPMHCNQWLLTDVLKKEWGFKGFVVSDMKDVTNLETGDLQWVAPDHKTALAKGINAGVDMINYCKNRADFIDPVLELVKEGRIPESRIDDAARRILRVKFLVGLFDQPALDVAQAHKSIGLEESHRIALQGAREAVTLLKNQNALLPLAPGRYKRIFVTGPDADDQSILGDWAGKQPENNVVTMLQGIRDAAGAGSTVGYLDCGRIRGKLAAVTAQNISSADPRLLNQHITPGDRVIDDSSIAEAGRRAAQADLCVLVVGGNASRWKWALRTYGESCDRPDINLYGRQLELVKAVQAAGKPVVVIIVNGPPLNEPWMDENIPAILYAFEPGMYGGQALGEILFGKVNPSGRLPYTIPQTVGQVPMYYYMRHSRYWTGYALGVGRAADKPAWEFGYGLSYTTYKYSNLTVPADVKNGDDIPVSVTVTNTGSMAGDTPVLLFTSAKYQSVAPAVKELKGFARIHLEPGESKVVQLTIKARDLAIWNAEMKHVIEPTQYKVAVGDQTGNVNLIGETVNL